MHTSSKARAAPAARNAVPSPPSGRRARPAALRRLVATALLAAWAGTAVAAAPGGPARSPAAPARGAGALLLLSFLLPLPLPAALVAPPDATRAPAATKRAPPCSGPQKATGCLAERQDLRRR